MSLRTSSTVRQLSTRQTLLALQSRPATPDSATIHIAPSPQLSTPSKMRKTTDELSYSASVTINSSPLLDSSGPRLTPAGMRAPSFSGGSLKKKHRLSSVSRPQRDSRRYGWKDFPIHFRRTAKGWGLVALFGFLVYLIRRDHRGANLDVLKVTMGSDDTETSAAFSAGMLNYLRDSAVAVGNKFGTRVYSVPIALSHRLPTAFVDRLPTAFGASAPMPKARTHRTAAHTYHPNGLLLVNPNSRHPIHGIIENAEKNWRAKLRRQSRDLASAVSEYQRRYQRNPPAGFSEWWKWATARDVNLLDEYDQISRDFEPFHALEPIDLRHRAKVMQDRVHTFTIAIDLRTGTVSTHGVWANIRRATDIKSLIETFSKSLPGVGSTERDEGVAAMPWLNLTFIVDDQPAVTTSYEYRARMKELASRGEYFGISEWVDDTESSLSNYARACPIQSPLRRSEKGQSIDDFSANSGTRSFIYDHNKAMDLCEHPEYRKLHGFTAGISGGVGTIVPLFTFAKMPLHSDILVTPLEQYADNYLGHDPTWSEKTKAKLMWRGSTTGARFELNQPWRESQRARLHFSSHEKDGEREILTSKKGKAVKTNVSNAVLNDFYMDTSFAGQPMQCDEATCKVMQEEIEFARTQGLDESYQYKYTMDVDGNGWSGRFHRLMSSHSLVLKSTVFPEWYSERIMPWVHYVPVKVDYSDLYDIMAFFVGTPDGRGAHDALAERIASTGTQWAKDSWRREDMGAYMFRVCLEYLRLLDRELGVEVDFLEN